MPTAPEALFDRLQDSAAVLALIGASEDTILDCKQWLGDDKGKRDMIARAVSGFANGDGGVILIGLVAEGRRDEPDLIKETALVPAPEEVKAKVLSYIQADVEPPVQSLRVEAVRMQDDGSGVVLVLVPSQDGLPTRSKRDWKFYLRSGSSTQNMPLTILGDRFGRRPHAELVVSLAEATVGLTTAFGPALWARFVDLYIENMGRGIARFPALLLRKDGAFEPSRNSMEPHPGGLWPYSFAEDRWHSWRGGSDAVIYPGEKLLVCKVFEHSLSDGAGVVRFAKSDLQVAAICEGSPLEEFSFTLPVYPAE